MPSSGVVYIYIYIQYTCTNIMSLFILYSYIYMYTHHLITYVIYNIYKLYIYIEFFSSQFSPDTLNLQPPAVLCCGAVQCQVVFAEWKAKEGQAGSGRGSTQVPRDPRSSWFYGNTMGTSWEYHRILWDFMGL